MKGSGVDGDILTEEVSAQSAYHFFKKQEEEVYEFEPTAEEGESYTLDR